MLKLPKEYDTAIIGIGSRCGEEDNVAYSVEGCINVLKFHHNMTEDDAMEWFHFNILGAYMGKGTPFFVWETLDLSDLMEDEDGDQVEN